MKKWVCQVCGYVFEGENPPEKCPQCGVPASKFTEQKGEMSWAAEHVVGVGKSFGADVPEEAQKEIIDGLNANFMGECTEVGMIRRWPAWLIARVIPESACTGRRLPTRRLSMLPSSPSCWAMW